MMALIPNLVGKVVSVESAGEAATTVVLEGAHQTYPDRSLLKPQHVRVPLPLADVQLAVGDTVSMYAFPLGEDLWESEGHSVLPKKEEEKT
jgi:hypothetical protein